MTVDKLCNARQGFKGLCYASTFTTLCDSDVIFYVTKGEEESAKCPVTLYKFMDDP